MRAGLPASGRDRWGGVNGNTISDDKEKTMELDLSTDEFTAQFAAAPVYRKSAVVNARPAVPGEQVVTTLADGTVETTVTCDGGEIVITNPGGELYVVGGEKFAKRYAPLGDGRFQARGMVRAVINPAGGDVTVIAPWGEEQHGGPACMFAVIYDPEEPEEVGSDRYLIGAAEFAETYALAADVTESAA